MRKRESYESPDFLRGFKESELEEKDSAGRFLGIAGDRISEEKKDSLAG